MKTIINELIKSVHGLIVVASLFLATAEAETIPCQILWSVSMIVISIISGKLFMQKYMTEEDRNERA